MNIKPPSKEELERGERLMVAQFRMAVRKLIELQFPAYEDQVKFWDEIEAEYQQGMNSPYKNKVFVAVEGYEPEANEVN
jgi:hypothetical protein